MDPNETLVAIRELIAEYDSGSLTRGVSLPSTMVVNLDTHLAALSAQIGALDGWLSKAGFLPEAWAKVNVDKTAVDAITELMSGKEWSPDTLESIADIVRMTGREIASSDECPHCDSAPCRCAEAVTSEADAALSGEE
jgi:hypothetical protein